MFTLRRATFAFKQLGFRKRAELSHENERKKCFFFKRSQGKVKKTVKGKFFPKIVRFEIFTFFRYFKFFKNSHQTSISSSFSCCPTWVYPQMARCWKTLQELNSLATLRLFFSTLCGFCTRGLMTFCFVQKLWLSELGKTILEQWRNSLWKTNLWRLLQRLECFTNPCTYTIMAAPKKLRLKSLSNSLLSTPMRFLKDFSLRPKLLPTNSRNQMRHVLGKI